MQGSGTAPGGRRASGTAAEVVGKIRLRPTQQGTVYLWTIAVFAFFMWMESHNLVFLLALLALASGAVAWFLARRNLRGLSVERDLPLRTQVATSTPLSWSLRMPGRRIAVGVELDDRPAPGTRPLRLQVDVPVVPGGAATTCATEITFGRRGLLNVGADSLEVASRYPLGLFRAEALVPVRGRILVRPREGRITSRLRALLRGRAEVEARRAQVWGGDDAIYGVREFREGDDPRRIHWRSTARRGTTIVTEWRTEQGNETVIVLGRSQGAGRPAVAAFERAVSCAATIWRACARERIRARLVLGDGREIALGASGRGLGGGLDALAHVEARGRRDPRRALKPLAQGRHARRSVLYLGSGPERGIEAEVQAAAGRGGTSVVLRADLRSILQWVHGVAR